MSYDIRTIAFLAEILHPPVELQAKTVQELHAELFDHPELFYRNFSMDQAGVHLTNPVEQPGGVSSVSFLPDRIQFREEMQGRTVEEFGTRILGIVERAAARIGIPMATAQQYVVRSLLNPRHHPDSRAFLAQATCKLAQEDLESFGRPLGLVGLKMVFPQTPEDPSLFAIRLESYNQDPRSLFVENVSTFTHCVLPAGIAELRANLETTYRFLDEKATSFLSRFDRAGGGEAQG